jgi:hypothetical protein
LQTTFLAKLHNLEVLEDLGRGDRVNDSLRITNNRAVLEALLGPSHRQLLGEMEAQALLAKTTVAVATSPLPPEMSPEDFLLARLYEVQGFLMTSWIVRDNSINCELGFLLYSAGTVAGASSNFIAHLFTMASGEERTTQLTREELREMRKLHRTALRLPEHPFERPSSQFTTRNARLSRALLLVNAARGADDVAIKLSHYCTAFETLFSTSHSELAHQLSERLATFLYTSGEERLAIYRRLKAAYALRSKFVHGATFREERLAEAISLSEFCDDQARKVFQRVLGSSELQALFKLDTQAFDESMLTRILSSRSF